MLDKDKMENLKNILISGLPGKALRTLVESRSQSQAW